MSEERMHISLDINGERWEDEVEPRLLLVDLIRDHVGRTGTHIGCEEGICGACTVDLDGAAVKSCMVFAVQAHGASITTVEGLADGEELHALQESFGRHQALQCGYCTPGMIMAARALLSQTPRPSVAEIRAGLVGNLCRCGTYQRIIEAVRDAAEPVEER
jgi:carbon-monoxide dehydrogenase small subunit